MNLPVADYLKARFFPSNHPRRGETLSSNTFMREDDPKPRQSVNMEQRYRFKASWQAHVPRLEPISEEPEDAEGERPRDLEWADPPTGKDPPAGDPTSPTESTASGDLSNLQHRRRDALGVLEAAREEADKTLVAYLSATRALDKTTSEFEYFERLRGNLG